MLRLASAVVGRLDLVTQTRAVLPGLAETLGETVNVAVLRSHYAVNVDQARGGAAVAAQNWTGQLTPLHATSSGKVLLAHQTMPGRRRLLDAARIQRFTAQTIVDRAQLTTQLDEIVRAGWALALEEYEEVLNALAAPIRDHTGDVIAALSVSGPSYRLDRARLETLRPDLISGAARVSELMGHRS